MNNENQTTKITREQEAGAFWIKKSKAGNSFLSGYFLNGDKEKVSVVVFKNNFKKPGEMSPDYRVYLSDNSKSQQAQLNTAPQDATPSEEENISDEIPF